jgi:hypothetical protein
MSTEPSHSELLRLREEAYLDPYRPLPPAPVSATGSDDPDMVEIGQEEEPNIIGTLFLSTIFLMIIAAIWIVMYILLLGR